MIDDISYKILSILQEKARIPNVEVARKVGMAPSAVLERIRKMEKLGIIDGYEVRLNPERFGRGLVAFLSLKIGAPSEDGRVERRLAEIPEVQEVHYLAGDDGYLVKVRVEDTRALGRLIRERIAPVDNVVGIRTRIALSTAKETARIPLAEKDRPPNC